MSIEVEVRSRHTNYDSPLRWLALIASAGALALTAPIALDAYSGMSVENISSKYAQDVVLAALLFSCAAIAFVGSKKTYATSGSGQCAVDWSGNVV